MSISCVYLISDSGLRKALCYTIGNDASIISYEARKIAIQRVIHEILFLKIVNKLFGEKLDNRKIKIVEWCMVCRLTAYWYLTWFLDGAMYLEMTKDKTKSLSVVVFTR